MKKIAVIFSTFALAFMANRAQAQCDSVAVFTGSQTIYMDSANTVQRTVDENTLIEISGKIITIMPGDDPVIKTTIISHDCKWQTPFKEGKSVLKLTVTKPNNESVDVTLVIEGKGGTVTCILTIDGEPNRRIKVQADRFEGKKA
jgi:hypothetical protein